MTLGGRNLRSAFAVRMDALPQLRKLDSHSQRRAYLKNNTRLLKYQSLTCLMVGESFSAFPCVRRDKELPAKRPPEIVLELEDETSIISLLLKMRPSTLFKILQIDTALFAYEPVLNTLKRMQAFPLSRELLFWREGDTMGRPDYPVGLRKAISALDKSVGDLCDVIHLDKPIVLDQSQRVSII